MDYSTTATTIQSPNNKSTSTSANCSPTNKANSSINNGFTNIKQQQQTINNGVKNLNSSPKISTTSTTIHTSNNLNNLSNYDESVDDPETSPSKKSLNECQSMCDSHVKNNLMVVDENIIINKSSNNHHNTQIKNNNYDIKSNNSSNNEVYDDNFYINKSSDKLINTEDEDDEDEEEERKSLLNHTSYTSAGYCDSNSSNNVILSDKFGGETQLNCDHAPNEPLLVEINLEPEQLQQNSRDSDEKLPKSIVKSSSTINFTDVPPPPPPKIEHERPTLHVQFSQNEELPCYSQNDPERHPIQLNTPTGSILSSSDSSSSSSEEESLVPVAPDGGWGWVVVFASFMVNLIADGVTLSFGVIFVEFLNYFEESKGKTAWIGSLFMAMPLLSGPIASFLTDRYGCRKVTIAGSILAAFGFVLSAFAQSMEVLCLTFGVISGFGLSLCYVAAVVIVAYYFDKRRSFATGLAVCGSGIGKFLRLI